MDADVLSEGHDLRQFSIHCDAVGGGVVSVQGIRIPAEVEG